MFDFEFLIPYIEIIIPGSLIIAIMLLLVPAMNKKYVAKARYFVWLMIAIRLLIPFDINFTKEPVHLINAPISDYSIIREDVVEYIRQENVDGTINQMEIFQNNDTINNTDITQTAPVKKPILADFPIIRLYSVIEWVWSLGCVGLLAYFIAQYFYAKRKMLKLSLADKSSRNMLDMLCNELNIKRKLKIYRCSCINTALIMGVVSPVIFIPDIEINDEFLEMMLRHELTHYKRNDILYKIVLMFACCMHWFNPLVWLMDRQAQKDIEICCDDDVIKGHGEEFKQKYSESILKMVKFSAMRKTAFSTGFTMDKKTLSSRFRNIFDNRIKHSGKAILATVLAICIMSTTLISCAPKQEEKFEIPQQAMELMEFFLVTFEDGIASDFLSNNLSLNYMTGFDYLLHINAPVDKYIELYDNNQDTAHYNFPFEKSKEIYQFLLSEKLGNDWNEPPKNTYSSHYSLSYNYNTFDFSGIEYKFNIVETKSIDENNFTSTFSRVIDGIPYNSIQFTMEKQIIDYVPEDLTAFYNSGDEMWRIKKVEILQQQLNPTPKTIEIGSKEDFISFINDMHSDFYYKEGNTYLITADIDMSGIEITALCPLPEFRNEYYFTRSHSNGFNCILDGQGHKISNINIKIPESTPHYNGLFTEIGPLGKIKNLTLENVLVIPDENSTSHQVMETGILAGRSLGTIENCNISGVVKGVNNVGGICGVVNGGEISNCTVNAQVYGSETTGQLTGYIDKARVNNCYVSGKVYGVRYTKHHYNTPWNIGSFAGYVSESDILNSQSDAELVLDIGGGRNGAFIGGWLDSNIINCSYSNSSGLEPIGFDYTKFYEQNDTNTFEIDIIKN